MALYCSPIIDNLNKYDCGMGRAGIKDIYVANLGDIADISSTAGDKEMDTITMNTNPTTSAPYYWYRIAFKKDTAGLNNEIQFESTTYSAQSLVFSAEGISKESLEVLETMATGEAVFIVKDYKGKYHLLGRINGLMMSAMSYGTGTAAGDIYGGEITFTGNEPELSNLVAPGTTIDVWDGTAAVPVTL